MKNKSIIITGMGRSGTSFTTNWLNKCGLRVGDKFTKILPGNKQGNFEDLEFRNWIFKVFEKNKLKSWITDKVTFEIGPELKAELNSIINRKNNNDTQWGFKDPRTCLFLDCFEEALKDSIYVFVYRHFEGTVDSLFRLEIALQKKRKNRILGMYNLLRHKLNLIDKVELKYMYLRAWINYNSKILKFIHSEKLKGRYFLFNIVDINKIDKSMIQFVNNNGFNLEYKSSAQYFDPKQFNSDPQTEIEDKQLVEQANKIYNQLEALSIKASIDN